MSLPELIREYLYFCKCKKDFYKTERLDLREIIFFKPTMLLPLLTFIKENDINEKDILLPSNNDVKNYFYTIYQGQIDYDNNYKRTYIPFTELPNDKNNADKLLKYIFSLVEPVGGADAFSFVIHELVDNVYEHSNFTHAYILVQKYNLLQYTDISICDNGKGIAGSLNEAGYNYNTDQHTQAILDAVFKGYTSKKQEHEERGYGLRDSVSIYQEYGDILIVSGYGTVHINNNEIIELTLSDEEKFNGTLITLRVPRQLQHIDIYRYFK